MAIRLRGPLAPRVDVALSSEENLTEAVGLEIVNHVVSKGFCVISTSFTESWAERAVVELREFDKADRWHGIHPSIQEGLLGQEGSATIAELESPDLADEVRSDGDMLKRFDALLTDMGWCVEPFLEHRLGFDVSHRTLAVVNQAGEPEEEEDHPLTEKQVMKWLAQFLRHKLMCIAFLGPTSGTLELQPYATSDTELYQVDTLPGTVVLLRPDLLSHRHFAPGRAYAMSSFFLTAAMPKRTPSAGVHMIPPARDLDEWTANRLRMLKEQDKDDQAWDPNIPRDWQNAMNHMYHKGQMIAVRGAACKMPRCDVPEDFWRVSTAGPDYIIEVPLVRWDHAQVYDEDRECWRRYKSYSKHASFMDGIEMFDCKMFSMTPNEAKTMDPHQRLILEVGYTALHAMGQRKNTLVNMSCGVYVGCGNTEWNLADKEADFGAFGATGAALSISSGRFSFILGLKGPSMTLDTEAASGATAVYLAAEACQKKGRAAANDMGCAIAAHILLTPVWWPSQCASGWLSYTGRCQTFDADADGYVRADGVASCGMKTLNQVVDGKVVSTDDEHLIGSLAGAMMNNNGRGANLSAPHGPAEQEAIAEAVRNASISPYDVDGVEAHATGSLLADAIEVSSLCRAHRTEDNKELLLISSMKSLVGNQLETSSLANFVKSLYSTQWGCVTPNVHLSTANPHMDAFDQPCALASDCLEYKMQTAFAGVMARGFGGSNVYLLGWGQIDDKKLPPMPSPSLEDQIYFWPGGGGSLEKESLPERAYKIVGTWSRWSEAHTMEVEEEGVYGFTITLGENRWEQFQIWLDGDPTRALHPGVQKALKGVPVWGPEESVNGFNWLVDGRGDLFSYGAAEDDAAAVEPPPQGPDTGFPGDRYRIRLYIAGKWRTVSWEKVQPSAEDGGQLPVQQLPAGTYFIAGRWNGWQCEEMIKDDAAPGLWYFDVTFTGYGEEFQIVRNSDWSQVFYPNMPGASETDAVEVLGPDDMGHDLNWYIKGTPGQVFRVEFQRMVDGAKDEKKVSWREVESN